MTDVDIKEAVRPWWTDRHDVGICACGALIGRDCDWYTPWGSASYDPPEPFDPVATCRPCSDARFRGFLADLLKRGLSESRGRPEWQSSDAWRRAKAVARGLWKHGTPRPTRHETVRVAYRNTLPVNYCACGRPEGHPKHEPGLYAGVCHFRLVVTRNLGVAEVRAWCACGFDSGWRTPARSIVGSRYEHESALSRIREAKEAPDA